MSATICRPLVWLPGEGEVSVGVRLGVRLGVRPGVGSGPGWGQGQDGGKGWHERGRPDRILQMLRVCGEV